jgi:hypothetical protein
MLSPSGLIPLVRSGVRRWPYDAGITQPRPLAVLADGPLWFLFARSGIRPVRRLPFFGHDFGNPPNTAVDCISNQQGGKKGDKSWIAKLSG